MSTVNAVGRATLERGVHAARGDSGTQSTGAAMVPQSPSDGKLRVVIVGGGLAALEGALAMAQLAPDRTDLIVIAPNTEFVDRPITVSEPFAFGTARRYPIPEIVDAAGADLIRGELACIDPGTQTVRTKHDLSLHYDGLLLALGAKRVSRYKHALTIGDRDFDESFHGLIQDIEEGYASHIAFVSPGRMESPLPLYEIALMTAARAYDMGVVPSISIITPEDAPLAVLGSSASAAVSDLLAQARIETITSAFVEIPSNGRLVIHPGDRGLQVDRVVALPELHGPSLRGIPLSEHGFVRVDQHQRVPHVGPVYAAGDVTQFAIKHVALASQEADAAAESIAALAGAPFTPKPFHPVIRGALLTGGNPLYFTADVTGGHGFSSDVSDRPMWSPAATVPAKYLAPVLDAYDREAAVTLEPDPRISRAVERPEHKPQRAAVVGSRTA